MKYILLLALFIAQQSSAQPAVEKEAIKKLCGCFEVEFKYAETFATDTAYKFHPRYHASGLEYVVAEEESPGKLVLQHLLLVGNDMVIKHWREDWSFESASLWKFTGDASWQQSPAKASKGQWTQTVWEVDDAPRYQGQGKWIHTDGKYYWENTADAPLPRREYTKRKDYNILRRGNRIIVTDSGWVHEQDNQKIVQKNSVRTLIAEEKGFNIYRRTADSSCAAAAKWWKEHRQFWNLVRGSWDELLRERTVLKLTSKVNNAFLYEALDEIEKLNLSETEALTRIRQTILRYIGAGKDSGVAAK